MRTTGSCLKLFFPSVSMSGSGGIGPNIFTVTSPFTTAPKPLRTANWNKSSRLSSAIASYVFVPSDRAMAAPFEEDAAIQLTLNSEFSGSSLLPKSSSSVTLTFSFVSRQNLYVIDLERGLNYKLTKDGGGTVHNGEAEFVAPEAMQWEVF